MTTYLQGNYDTEFIETIVDNIVNGNFGDARMMINGAPRQHIGCLTLLVCDALTAITKDLGTATDQVYRMLEFGVDHRSVSDKSPLSAALIDERRRLAHHLLDDIETETRTNID